MIYKTFFGKHIDLSRVVSISDAEYSKSQNQVFFEIHVQMLDSPIVYRRYPEEPDEVINYPTHSVTLRPKLILSDGSKVWGNEVTEEQNKNLVCVRNLQAQVDEIIKAWTDSRDKSQTDTTRLENSNCDLHGFV